MPTYRIGPHTMSRTPNTTPAAPTDGSTSVVVARYATPHGARSYMARATAPVGWVFVHTDLPFSTPDGRIHAVTMRTADAPTPVPATAIYTAPTARVDDDTPAMYDTPDPADDVATDLYRAAHGTPAPVAGHTYGTAMDRADDARYAPDAPTPADRAHRAAMLNRRHAATGITVSTTYPDGTTSDPVTYASGVGTIMAATPGAVRVATVPDGTRVQFDTYDTNGHTGTSIGVVGRATGMARLGNLGRIVTTPDGTEHVVSRYAYVVPVYDIPTDAPTPDPRTPGMVARMVGTDAPTGTYGGTCDTPDVSHPGSGCNHWMPTTPDTTVTPDGHYQPATPVAMTYDDITPAVVAGSANDPTVPPYTLRNAVWNAVRMEWMQLRDGIMTRVSSTYAPDGTRSCGHSYAGYGACIAPYGHANRDHIDASGHRFYGPAMATYDTPIGCDTPPARTAPRSTYGVAYTRTDIPVGADPRTYPNTVYVTARTMNDAMTYVGHAYGTVTNIWSAPTATPTDAVTDHDLPCTTPHTPAPTATAPRTIGDQWAFADSAFTPAPTATDTTPTDPNADGVPVPMGSVPVGTDIALPMGTTYTVVDPGTYAPDECPLGTYTTNADLGIDGVVRDVTVVGRIAVVTIYVHNSGSFVFTMPSDVTVWTPDA